MVDGDKEIVETLCGSDDAGEIVKRGEDAWVDGVKVGLDMGSKRVQGMVRASMQLGGGF